MELANASLPELAAELNKADTALALRHRVGFFRKYRQAIKAEIDRRCPIDPQTAAMSDTDLLASLES
jgi:hypothetical protein